MKSYSAVVLAAASLAIGASGSVLAAPAAADGVLTAAQVNRQIVGHRVEAEDGAMTWRYKAGGQYDGDDGRNARGGTYVVRADGRLCWTENSGIKGCFQYYRQGGKLNIRRADTDNRFELGAVKVGPLD